VHAALLALLMMLMLPLQDGAADLAVLKANLGGDCSADFTVTDAAAKPIYAASIRVRVRYGAFGIKRADLEVGTGSDGRARIEGLPNKARPMTYTIEKGDRHTSVDQDVAQTCHATFAVALK
jgi:hypothetical protein